MPHQHAIDSSLLPNVTMTFRLPGVTLSDQAAFGRHETDPKDAFSDAVAPQSSPPAPLPTPNIA
jgi:hypothetical protein